jgi:WD40 repeat protein
VGRTLETICLKALEKEPARRYASAEDLAVDLRHWLDGEPITARAVSPAAKAWMWCRRNRKVAAVLLVLSLLTALSTSQWMTAETLKLRAERDASSLAIDGALDLCRRGEVGRGLLQLAAALRAAPRDSEDLKAGIRANISAWMPHATRLRAVLFHELQVYFGTYSPDGRTILTLGSRGHEDMRRPAGDGARLWEQQTLKPIGGLIKHGSGIHDAAFHPDGRSFATCGGNGLVRFWRVSDGMELGGPIELPGQLWSLAYSPNGRTLMVGTSDRRAYLWDTVSGEMRLELTGHRSDTFRVGFLDKGRRGLTACLDGKLRLWDLGSGSLLDDRATAFRMQSENRPGMQFASTTDGTMFLTNRIAGESGESGAQLWDAASPESIGKPLRHEARVNAVALSADGTVAATGSDDKSARLWDPGTGALRIPPLPHPARVMVVVLNADGSTVLTGTEDGTAQLWSVATGEPIGDPMRHPGPVVRAAIHPSGREVLIAAERGMAQVWTLPDPAEPRGTPVTEASFEEGPPNIAYSPDRKRMLVGYSDAPAKVRDAETQFETGISLPHQHAVIAVAWSTDGRWLATAGSDGVVRIWSADTGRPIRQIEAHLGSVRSIVFSRDGQYLLTGGEDRLARLWHAPSGKPVGPALAHPTSVDRVAFGPDRQTILTRAEDQVARRWRFSTGGPASDEAFLDWVSLATGTRVSDGSAFEALDSSMWRELHARRNRAGEILEVGAIDGQ